jgi:hypothetical protein
MFLSEESYPEDLVKSFQDPSLMNVIPLERLYLHIYTRQQDPKVEIAFEFKCYESKRSGPLMPRQPRRQLHQFDDIEPSDYSEVSMPEPDADKGRKGKSKGSSKAQTAVAAGEYIDATFYSPDTWWTFDSAGKASQKKQSGKQSGKQSEEKQSESQSVQLEDEFDGHEEPASSPIPELYMEDFNWSEDEQDSGGQRVDDVDDDDEQEVRPGGQQKDGQQDQEEEEEEEEEDEEEVQDEEEEEVQDKEAAAQDTVQHHPKQLTQTKTNPPTRPKPSKPAETGQPSRRSTRLAKDAESDPTPNKRKTAAVDDILPEPQQAKKKKAPAKEKPKAPAKLPEPSQAKGRRKGRRGWFWNLLWSSSNAGLVLHYLVLFCFYYSMHPLFSSSIPWVLIVTDARWRRSMWEPPAGLLSLE